MLNLFKRVYIKHDNNLFGGGDRRRIIVTEKDFEYQFTTNQALLNNVGVNSISRSMSELEAHYGGLEGFWSNLAVSDQKIVVIASEWIATQLLIQYWKSIFKEVTASELYHLYRYFVSNENMISLRSQERVMVEKDANAKTVMVVPIDESRFSLIFDQTQPSQTLMSTLKKEDLPIEYLLMGVFSQTLSGGVTNATYKKVRKIVLDNIVSQLHSAKDDLFSETHNFYLLTEGGATSIMDPIAFMKSEHSLRWLLDEEFTYANIQGVLKKYTLDDLKSFYRVYSKLMRFEYDEERALEFIMAGNIAGLLMYDVHDEKGNFLGSEDHINKVNGLLVSWIYEKVRKLEYYQLKAYQLR